MLGRLSSAFSWWRAPTSDDFAADEAAIDETEDDLIQIMEAQMNSPEDGDVAPPPSPPSVSQSEPKYEFRTGQITKLNENYVVIDSKYDFDRKSAPALKLELGQNVSYMVFRISEEHEWRVKQIFYTEENDENWDSDGGSSQEAVVQEERVSDGDNVVREGSASQRTVTGIVVIREGREVVVRDYLQLTAGGTRPRNTRFSLDSISSEFTPLKGDMVNMKAYVEIDEQTLDLSGEVLEVISIAPTGARAVDSAEVKKWYKDRYGCIDDDIYFEKRACVQGYIPRKGDEVSVEAVECDRTTENGVRGGVGFKWRALTVEPINISQRLDEYVRAPQKRYHRMDPELLKDKGNLVVQELTDFGRLPTTGNFTIGITISNKGETTKIIKHYINAAPSNLILHSPRSERVKIGPNDDVTIYFKYVKESLGFFSEEFIIEFGSFKIGRVIKWEVFDEKLSDFTGVEKKDDKFYQDSKLENVEKLLEIQRNRQFCIPGVPVVKAPSFVKFRIKLYEVPTELFRIMTEGSDGKLRSRQDARRELQEQFPELKEQLSATNYYKRFHTVLHIAEVDALIELSGFSKQRVRFLRRGPASEYLALEMPGLATGRPSLIVGDTVIVKDSFSHNGARLKGYIHKVMSNEVWIKFMSHFHASYNNEDYDVYFELSRGCLRKSHAALEICQQSQASLWLFPKGVTGKPKQVDFLEPESYAMDAGRIGVSEDCSTSAESVHGDGHVHSENLEGCHGIRNGAKVLKWINKRLNHRQKEAVRNILRGEARPLPYIIFGPPGTGKTLTLVETILQLYLLMGNSRLLVATPSNSSANLLAERLVASGVLQPGDMVRLVAYHLISEGKIPVELAPYCATLDISAGSNSEDTDRSVPNFGSNVILRKRIVIGTCMALGQLISLGLPRGHFSHVVVDEAGQAQEPEILIPLSFMAHESGQAILAGDPNQLGPVVQSNLAGSFGLSKSLLARILPRFPYERDSVGFTDSGGYDPRLVTRLTLNYRSLPDILELPSTLFYDGDLDPAVSEEDCYEAKLLARARCALKLPNSAVVFHGVKGCLFRDADSPSYYNPYEVVTVCNYVNNLLDAKFKCQEIGVITPYQKQASKIRQSLARLSAEGEDIDAIKVGSVEEFQGQERMVIILSTVRTVGGESIERIERHTARQLLGFVSNPERLNVAISRARALLIVIGDTDVLWIDPYWRSVVKYCEQKTSIIGVGPPKYMDI